MDVETKRLVRQIITGAVIFIITAAVTVALIFTLLDRLPDPTPEVRKTVPQTTATPAPTLPQSGYTAADFALDGEFLTCLSNQALLGIDVSSHQRVIDWEAVAAAGIDFAIVRLGYRGYETGLLNADTYVQENLTGAREAGLLVGAYFFSQATSTAEAEEEARYALELLGDFELDLPLVFDWEVAQRTEEVDKATVTDCALAFCAIAESAGVQPMIYFNPYQITAHIDLFRLTDYPWWLALYNTDPVFPCRFDMWQYSCTGSVPGIEGNVDLNIIVLDETALS